MLIQRTKGKLNADYKLIDMYKFYCTYSKKPVDYNTYRKICLLINKTIINKVIKENLLFILPYRGGNISIRKYKNKLRERVTENGNTILNQPVDWKATKEMWLEEPELKGKKVIYIDNEHTDGYKFKFIWNTFNAKFKNKYLSGFKPLRKISRLLALEIKTNPDFDTFERWT